MTNRSWQSNQMIGAVCAVLQGELSQRNASRDFGVPRTTLQEYIDAIKRSYTPSPQPTGEILKVVVIGDAHDSPNLEKDRFTVAGKFVDDIRPDIVVDIGDSATMDSLNTHIGNATWGGRFKGAFEDDLASYNEALQRFSEELNYTPKKHKAGGNHDYSRLELYENEHPEVKGMLLNEMTEVLHKYDWEQHPFGEEIFLGGVSFVHMPLNIMGRALGGKNAANTIARDSNYDRVYGHDHRANVHTEPKLGGGPFETGNFIRAVGVGCFLPWGHVENYAKHNMTGWWQGLTELTIFDGHIQGVRFHTTRELERKYT